MVRITSLSGLLTPTVVVLTLLIWGGAVTSIPKPRPNAPAVNSATSQSVQADDTTFSEEALNTTTLNAEPAESCSESTTETTNNTGSNSTNISSTDVSCAVDSETGSSSVNISNDVNQSATSGESTGQSGEASNSNSTEINIQSRGN